MGSSSIADLNPPTPIPPAHRDVLKRLRDPAKLVGELASEAAKAAEHGGWVILLYERKRIGEALKAKKNRVLAFLATGFDKLNEIFDPSKDPEPRKRPIGFVAERLGRSQKEAAAILKAGPFSETFAASFTVSPWNASPLVRVPKNLSASFPLSGWTGQSEVISAIHRQRSYFS